MKVFLPVALVLAPAATAQERVPVMGGSAFWSIVDASRMAAADPGEQADYLRALLDTLDPAALVAFQNAYDHQVNLGFSYDMWDAGLLIRGSMNEDDFRPFRCWLVAQGSKVWRAALENPDTLAALLPPDTRGPAWSGALCTIGAEVWAGKTGESRLDVPVAESAPIALSGLPYGDDAEGDAARHLPALAARFAADPLD